MKILIQAIGFAISVFASAGIIIGLAYLAAYGHWVFSLCAAFVLVTAVFVYDSYMRRY